MARKENLPEISCPVFLRREWAIKQLTSDINSARNISDKADRAQDLINEVDSLLNCKDYNEKNEDCKNCRTISKLRQETAQLFVQAKGITGFLG